jgi:transcriptional regulator with XRE-family HTH domain
VATYAILRSLGAEVQERREQQNLTQEELADLSGFHRNVVGRLEGGEYNTTVLTLAAIAGSLNLSLAELFAAADRRV